MKASKEEKEAGKAVKQVAKPADSPRKASTKAGDQGSLHRAASMRLDAEDELTAVDLAQVRRDLDIARMSGRLDGRTVGEENDDGAAAPMELAQSAFVERAQETARTADYTEVQIDE